MKIESYKCDVCGKTMDKGQLRFLFLPVKTHCNWTDGMPEADIHHEMHGDDDFCSYGKRKENT